ncbi:MAG TPA: oligosaccharide flippase family protein [Anaerolineales bacterium]|nr:oligosaccharide flippase family protein [Anaerolineales bacterium]
MRLYKNILWTVGSRYGSQALAVISNLLLARYLGSAGFGEYAFITAVVLIGNAFSTFGTDMILIRRISSANDFSDLPAALVLQLSISVIFILLAFVLAPFLPVQRPLLIYVFALVPLSFFTIFTTILRGVQQMDGFSILHFTSALTHLLAVLLLLGVRGSVAQLAFYLLGVHVIGAALGFFLCRGFLEKWAFFPHRIPALIKSSARMALIGTLRLLYEKITLTILPVLTTVNETGIFASSARTVDAAKLGHLSALTAVYPEMARTKLAGAHLNRSGLWLFAAAVMIALMLFLFAEPILLLLFGREFSSSASALRILAWTLIPYFIVSYYSLAFVAVERETAVLSALGFAFLILVALLVWLVPSDGLRGAAWSILIAEIVQAALLWNHWRRYVRAEPA